MAAFPCALCPPHGRLTWPEETSWRGFAGCGEAGGTIDLNILNIRILHTLPYDGKTERKVKFVQRRSCLLGRKRLLLVWPYPLVSAGAATNSTSVDGCSGMSISSHQPIGEGYPPIARGGPVCVGTWTSIHTRRNTRATKRCGAWSSPTGSQTPANERRPEDMHGPPLPPEAASCAAQSP